jgi:hypothetical protein
VAQPLDDVRAALRESRRTLEGGLAAIALGGSAEPYLVAGLNLLDGLQRRVEQLVPAGERRQRAAEMARTLELLEQRARAVRQQIEREAAGCDER